MRLMDRLPTNHTAKNITEAANNEGKTSFICSKYEYPINFLLGLAFTKQLIMVENMPVTAMAMGLSKKTTAYIFLRISNFKKTSLLPIAFIA